MPEFIVIPDIAFAYITRRITGELVIDWFQVYKEYRGKGYGRKLFKKVLQFAKEHNCHKVILQATPTSLGFWLKMVQEFQGFFDGLDFFIFEPSNPPSVGGGRRSVTT